MRKFQEWLGTLECFKSLSREFEREFQRALNADFSIAKILRVENFRELAPSRFTIQHLGIDSCDLFGCLLRDFTSFRTKVLSHGAPEPLSTGIDQLHFAASLGVFPVGEEPDIGLNAGIIEKVGGECDDRFNPVVFHHPAADFALTRCSSTCEERRSVHDDANPRALLIIAHLRNHMLQEQQLPV